jgi:hypothetical protein
MWAAAVDRACCPERRTKTRRAAPETRADRRKEHRGWSLNAPRLPSGKSRSASIVLLRDGMASAAFALQGHKTIIATNRRAAAATSHQASAARIVRFSAFMRAAKPHKSRFAAAATASHPKIETRITHQHTDLMVSWCLGSCLGSMRGATTLLQVGEPSRRIGAARAVSHRMVKGWLMQSWAVLCVRCLSGT